MHIISQPCRPGSSEPWLETASLYIWYMIKWILDLLVIYFVYPIFDEQMCSKQLSKCLRLANLMFVQPTIVKFTDYATFQYSTLHILITQCLNFYIDHYMASSKFFTY